MSYKDNDPYLQFTGKIDPLSEIRNAGIVTNGRVYWVKSPTDADYVTLQDQVGRDRMGTGVNAVLTPMRNDRNDYALVTPTDSGTSYVVGTAIDVNKRRVHIVGVGATNSRTNKPTFEGYVAANGIDTEMMFVTSEGAEVRGIKLLGTSGTHLNGTMTSLLRIGTSSSGTPHGASFVNVDVESTQAAAANGTADVVTISGNVATGIRGLKFEACWIGNWNWAPTNGVVNMSGTAGPTRPEFADTTFVIDAQATTDVIVTSGTGVMEYSLYDRCRFLNVEAGTAPASAIAGASLADNPILLDHCFHLNVTQAGTDTEVFKAPVASGTSTVVRDYGIAVGTAALVPV